MFPGRHLISTVQTPASAPESYLIDFIAHVFRAALRSFFPVASAVWALCRCDFVDISVLFIFISLLFELSRAGSGFEAR